MNPSFAWLILGKQLLMKRLNIQPSSRKERKGNNKKGPFSLLARPIVTKVQNSDKLLEKEKGVERKKEKIPLPTN